MHQNKPTAPITYLSQKGEVIDVTNWSLLLKHIYKCYFNIQELALLQTLANRSLINCNCNLDKKVMKSVVDKINKSFWALGVED
jgi:hypothetical protein